MQTIRNLLPILYRRSLTQTTNHSKPILIPILYHTSGGTLKNAYSASFVRTYPLDVIAYNYDVLYTNE